MVASLYLFGLFNKIISLIVGLFKVLLLKIVGFWKFLGNAKNVKKTQNIF